MRSVLQSSPSFRLQPFGTSRTEVREMRKFVLAIHVLHETSRGIMAVRESEGMAELVHRQTCHLQEDMRTEETVRSHTHTTAYPSIAHDAPIDMTGLEHDDVARSETNGTIGRWTGTRKSLKKFIRQIPVFLRPLVIMRSGKLQTLSDDDDARIVVCQIRSQCSGILRGIIAEKIDADSRTWYYGLFCYRCRFRARRHGQRQKKQETIPFHVCGHYNLYYIHGQLRDISILTSQLFFSPFSSKKSPSACLL
jgi:hypothetical protein